MREAFNENRRAIIFGGAGLGLLIIVLLFKLLAGGGGGPIAFTPSTSPTTAPSAGAPGGAATTTTTGAGTGGSQVYTSKDPFRPLVDTSAGSGTSSGGGATSGSGGGSTSGSGSAGSGPTTSTTLAGASGAGAAPGGSTSPASPTSGQLVQVLDVHSSGKTTEAAVEVNSTEYQVSPGETFAGNYYVVDLSISTQCGDFTHGGAPFHACKGQKVLK